MFKFLPKLDKNGTIIYFSVFIAYGEQAGVKGYKSYD
jgi:hypothetical protein